MDSEFWAEATAEAFDMLLQVVQEEYGEVTKPEWWNDEGLKALSARVVRAAPDDWAAHRMRAVVLRGHNRAWEAGPRSAAELKEAATYYERAAALQSAPAVKALLIDRAESCRSRAEVMQRVVSP